MLWLSPFSTSFCMFQRRCLELCTNKVAYPKIEDVCSYVHHKVHLFCIFKSPQVNLPQVMSTSGVWWRRAGCGRYPQTDSGTVWSWRCLQGSCCPGACGRRWSETQLLGNGLERTPRSPLRSPASESSEHRAGRDSTSLSAPGPGRGAHTPGRGEGRYT